MHRDELPIPEPCSADWNAMGQRDKGRFCAQCATEVVDVSAYDEKDAPALVARGKAGKVCMSYIVRADGRIRFADTPRLGREVSPRLAPDAPDIPVRSLIRRGRAMVAAATFALAACGPGRHATRVVGALEPRSETEGGDAETATDPATTAPDPVATAPGSTGPSCHVETEERVRGEMAPAPTPPTPAPAPAPTAAPTHGPGAALNGEDPDHEIRIMGDMPAP